MAVADVDVPERSAAIAASEGFESRPPQGPEILSFDYQQIDTIYLRFGQEAHIGSEIFERRLHFPHDYTVRADDYMIARKNPREWGMRRVMKGHGLAKVGEGLPPVPFETKEFTPRNIVFIDATIYSLADLVDQYPEYATEVRKLESQGAKKAAVTRNGEVIEFKDGDSSVDSMTGTVVVA